MDAYSVSPRIQSSAERAVSVAAVDSAASDSARTCRRIVPAAGTSGRAGSVSRSRRKLMMKRRLVLHWRGGDHTALKVKKNTTGKHRWTVEDR
jgi:hypothetical protein